MRGFDLYAALRRSFLPVCLLILLACLAPLSQSLAAEPADKELGDIWAVRLADLQDMMNDVQAMCQEAKTMAGPTAESVHDARVNFARLTSLFQASRGHPTEQLTLLQQMNVLFAKFAGDIKQLQDISGSVEQRLTEISSLQADMEELLKESAADGVNLQGGSGAEAKNLAAYSRALDQARRVLQAESSSLRGILAPAEMAVGRMRQSIKDTEASVYEVWRQYYLTPSGNYFTSLASAPVILADWGNSMSARLSFAYPQDRSEWFGAGLRFLAAGGILLLLGLLLKKASAQFPGLFQSALRDICGRPWSILTIGLAVLFASVNARGGLYFAFVLLGSLLLIEGMASLSWRLRVAVAPELESTPSPMRRFYPAAAVGVLMLFSDLPNQILVLAWGAVMGAFLVYIFKRNRKNQNESRLPLLERFSYSCAFFFGLFALVVSLAGYARLSILIYMALFALVNVLILGNALMALTVAVANRLFEGEKKPMLNAAAQAVGIPLSWVFSLICTIPWFMALPGARYVIVNFMQAGYTVGQASFDFSKLLFIVLLFFLFKAFIGLGQTSLKHLPDKMPHVERGVVQPLSGLLTYGLWILFILVVLGMLGVNFTSLAVVAGGLSVGIGFGMQNIFNNLISGLMLIFGRTLLVGDFVDIGGFSGTVQAITIRSTVLETGDRSLVYIPNSSLMASPFTNWTRNGRMVRRNIVVGVAYGSDTALVSKVLLDAAKGQEHVLANPAPFVVFSNFADSYLEFILYIYIDDISNGLGTLSAVRQAIDKGFEKYGIDIPFPQMTLHMPAGGSIAENEAENNEGM